MCCLYARTKCDHVDWNYYNYTVLTETFDYIMYRNLDYKNNLLIFSLLYCLAFICTGKYL